MGDFATVWDEAGHSAEVEASQRALAQAKIASASIWSFLAVAQDSAEFGQRLDLAGDTLVAAASAHGVEVADLVAAYTREYRLLAESRKTAGTLPDALKEHQFKSVDEQDEEEGETDQQKESSRTAGQSWPGAYGPLHESEGWTEDSAAKARENWEHRNASPGDSDWSFDKDDPDSEQNPENQANHPWHGNPSEGDDWNAPSGGSHFSGTEGTPSHQSSKVAGGAQNAPGAEDGRPYEDPDDDGDDDGGDPEDTRTADEKYRDAGNWYKENTPGDITDKFYDKLSMLKKALEEGEDPLAWVAGEDGGQGQPEKPIEHDTQFDDSNGYSEVPAGGLNQQGSRSRHPFAREGSRHQAADDSAIHAQFRDKASSQGHDPYTDTVNAGPGDYDLGTKCRNCSATGMYWHRQASVPYPKEGYGSIFEKPCGGAQQATGSRHPFA